MISASNAPYFSKEECIEKYGALLAEIMEYLCNENHPNLFLHGNGLLYTNGHDRAVTWMNSTANGRPVIPRTGYVVEINALWYNALCFVADLLGKEEYKELAEKTGVSFISTFLDVHSSPSCDHLHSPTNNRVRSRMC